MKTYIAKEGRFFTDWEIEDYKAFLTKKALHEYMEKKHGFSFRKNKSDVYHSNEEIYENINEEYGYEVIKIEIMEKENQK